MLALCVRTIEIVGPSGAEHRLSDDLRLTSSARNQRDCSSSLDVRTPGAVAHTHACSGLTPFAQPREAVRWCANDLQIAEMGWRMPEELNDSVTYPGALPDRSESLDKPWWRVFDSPHRV
jgi:hypothetical protein